jgi:drug/metabolite transporter (DMT)-like permease
LTGQATSNFKGIGFMLAGAGAFVLNDSMMKVALVDALPTFEVAFLRGVAGTLWMVLALVAMGLVGKVPLAFNRHVIGRGLLEVAAFLAFIVALSHAPIGDITAIFQITPLLIILGMAIFHREVPSGLLLALVAIGFGGALLVAQPGTGDTSSYALLAFATALFAALRDLVGRNIPAQTPVMVSTLTIVLVLVCSLVAGLATETWHMPALRHVLLMAAAGLLMMLGHIFTFLAFRHAQAQAVAPFYYAFMVWAVALGFLIFGDVPNALALVGMGLILASGLGVIALERRKG